MSVASIVYASGSGILRGLNYAETIEHLAKASICQPGEALIIVDPADVKWTGRFPFYDQAAVQAVVDAERGRPADVARCAVIDDATADVVDVKLADPALDSVDGHTLFPNVYACIGCTFDADGHAVPPAVEAA